MRRDSRAQSLSHLARVGFSDLEASLERVHALTEMLPACDDVSAVFKNSADPDSAIVGILGVLEAHEGLCPSIGESELERLAMLLGASPAFTSVFVRHPQSLPKLLSEGGRRRTRDDIRSEMLASIRDAETGAVLIEGTGWNALRTRYRELLAELMLFDLEGSLAQRNTGTGSAAEMFIPVSETLSDLAEGAIEAALAVARETLTETGGSGLKVKPEILDAVPLAVVAMGKCGARELNVVSDVDVLFITEPVEAVKNQDILVRTATRIAVETMRAIHDPAIEPALWQLDPNLRPEGKNGPLVRTLGSYMKYYERWAEQWEFQALLKARAIAGDRDLAERFVKETRPFVWEQDRRHGFVGSVQRMRERVTEHIAPDEVDRQLKLGPGGLRDVEFSVQLLQLVHGTRDETLRESSTIGALEALVNGGYVARVDGDALSAAYRETRVLEHRLQLKDLRRTALMPLQSEARRVLARASGFAPGASELTHLWEQNKRLVRSLHVKIFYAPLLSAVAELSADEHALSSDRARDRLFGIGFKDPDGALRHLAALTDGASRSSTILRNLLPVLLGWLGDGADPDQGLIAFRRITEASSDLPWYLRLLRDGSDAAPRLMRVLSSSRFASDLLEAQPEATAWLDNTEELQPRSLVVIEKEMQALAKRREDIKAAAKMIRSVHRREVLRLALARVTGVIDDTEVASGLNSVHTALIRSILDTVLRLEPKYDGLRIALIAMGRFGGGEMGFSSDLDLIAVYEATPQRKRAAEDAGAAVRQLKALISDPKFAVDLDFDLRPEGKNGPFARTVSSYETYYRKWSLTWEAQALLRARPVAGDSELAHRFVQMIQQVRYPESISDANVREIRMMKARVETERLPRGADPARHLKLGKGGISDTEWLVQLLQLQHAHNVPEMQTTSTLEALNAAVSSGFVSAEDASALSESWQLASSLRSAEKLWSDRSTDTLPTQQDDLEGIARILGFGEKRTMDLENAWLGASRRARQVFEQLFYGFEDLDSDLAE